ncbi:MAG: cryptochrome/photolyase family protein [Woeseiaceae bacterium]
MANPAPAIVWFRQDLRLADNPALDAATRDGRPILPLYILDDENSGDWKMGAASRWWLHQSLKSLSESLNDRVVFFRGDAKDILPTLIRDVGADSVFWNRCYEPWRIKRDTAIKDELQNDGIAVRTSNGSALFEPPNTNKPDGTPYRVFTPFYRRGCLQNGLPPRRAIPAPDTLSLLQTDAGVSLEELDLLPNVPWYDEMASEWLPGEAGAVHRLQAFMESGLGHYEEGRNRPDQRYVSRLSPHLHFGEISPNQAWFAVHDNLSGKTLTLDADRFLSELGWREFSYNLLYNVPELPKKNLQRKFEAFPWRSDEAALRCWQRGQTGYPIVDAGMRELWQTGYMHNRVRMIVGSFLVKNLLLHWRHGAQWFWDTLVDADLANNSASWQWIAGCGADAAPYFRIFNPVTQGKKFDPQGLYVRRFIPALAAMPDKFVHNPWEAPADVLARAGVSLGSHYPEPVVDLKSSRERALSAFKSLGRK